MTTTDKRTHEGARLTERQRHALRDIVEAPLPWKPVSRSVTSVCRMLERMGLASYRRGYPVGFEATEAGRRALAPSPALEREEGR